MAYTANSESIFCRANGLLALSFLLGVLLLSSTFALAQQSAKSTPDSTLRISGKIQRPMIVRRSDLQRLPRKRA